MDKENSKTQIIVKNHKISVITINDKEYISLTDLARYANSEEPKIPIQTWMRNKNIILYLGLWEKINNENFKGHEFTTFEQEAGKNSFYMSPHKLIKETSAIGIVSKSGNNGGTFAHSDIAFEFASWLSQELMAKLYDTTKNNISIHMKNIFECDELDENSVVKKILTTASDGKNYNVMHYNLDAIIAVGYRINAKKATDFRIWATSVLREYIIKGFALNDDKLKNNGINPYFEGLLARIRDIMSSEKVFWRKVLYIYVDVSIGLERSLYKKIQIMFIK